MKVFKISLHKEEDILLETEEILKKGGVAIVPTDTVYGLICDGMDESAKRRIYDIKGRDENKPLIGFVDTIDKVKIFAEVPPEKENLLKRNWPGAKTYILTAKREISLITAETGKIAFRIPDHGFLLKLLKGFDIVASTSANFSGEKAPSSIEEIPDALKEKVDIIIDGGSVCGKPSEIWDITEEDYIKLR